MAPTPNSTRTRRRWLLASRAGLIVFSLAPRASLAAIAQANGPQIGFGWLTLISGLVALTIALEPRWILRRARTGRRRRIGLYASGGLAVGDCVLVILATPNSQYGALLASRWGVYLTLIPAMGLLAGTRGKDN